jgi:hypothetical protein
MLMIDYRWTTSVIGCVIAISIFWLVRQDRLHSKYAIWWLPIAGIVAFLGFFPHRVSAVAALLGISYAPALPIVLGLGVILLKILLMDIERSKNEIKLQRLAQHIALLEMRLNQLSEKQKTQKKKE